MPIGPIRWPEPWRTVRIVWRFGPLVRVRQVRYISDYDCGVKTRIGIQIRRKWCLNI